MNGWIKLHRSLLDWEWFREPDTLSVFLYLLLSARTDDGAWKGQLIRRGQVVTGRQAISTATGVSERGVRTALERLKTTNEVTIKTTNKFSIVTIEKWDLYQGVLGSLDQQNDQQGGQQTTRKRPQRKNIRRGEERKPSCAFDRFWEAYPRKIGKVEALKAFEKVSPDEAKLEAMLAALHKQSANPTWTKDNGQYIPYPATWLNGHRWEDEQPTEQREGATLKPFE